MLMRPTQTSLRALLATLPLLTWAALPGTALGQSYGGYGAPGGYGSPGAGGLGSPGMAGGLAGPSMGRGMHTDDSTNPHDDTTDRSEMREKEPTTRIPAPKLETPPADADAISAVVNGDVITRAEVDNRARLFALSTGLALTPELLQKLRPQFTRELIDDRLRLQEIQRRKIVVADADVAQAIAQVEERNHLPPGGLRAKLSGQGVNFSTLINQMRISLGWTRVLRQEIAERGLVTPAEIAEQEAIFKRQTGQPQYRVGEIFVPAEDPSKMNDARKFADTVIQQLRAGAPFGMVAAEFSQSETALEGGSLGWVRPDQLDPQVADLVKSMPQGAISNPVRVAGGFDVVTLEDKRLIGSDLATVLSLRQAFYPFAAPLDPQSPTAQQRQALADAQALSKTATSCDTVAAANKAQGERRPSDPGDVRLDHLNPQMQQLLGALKPGEPSKALVTPEGVMVVMVCSSAQKNLAAMTREDIANQLISARVELASRQLLQDLKRKALIDQRSS
jgi:peptidyl-prolyl cis-trans isomerase SurA